TLRLYDYLQVTNALTADATSVNDSTAVSNLPIGTDLDVYINYTSNNPYGSGSATPYLAADGRNTYNIVCKHRISAIISSP
ncbi:MAG: hypothetical protein JJ992_23155, partial [Planctomycetes bacterium]|nr:hypothetical protein [Planctomycetota bacterium]